MPLIQRCGSVALRSMNVCISGWLARRVGVGQHVDPPLQIPRRIGRVGTAAPADASVGEPQVDRAELRLDRIDELLRGTGVGHVQRPGHDLPAIRQSVGPDVGGHDRAGAGVDERPYERTPDPSGGPRDNGDLPSRIHGWRP